MQVIETHTVKISNRLYTAVLDLHNTDQVE